MSYVKPDMVVEKMAEAGAYKAGLSARDVLIRAFLSGAILGFATTLAYTATVQTELGITGALVFPAGFAMIILLGLELVTSNFALVPVACADGRAGKAALARSWALGFLGNLAGSVFYACLFYAVASKLGHATDSALIKKVVSVAEAKTLGYAHLGAEGLVVAFISAVLCNWMVSLGAVMSYTTTSTGAKIAAMWLPILTFFAQGYEHSVVNMFVVPAGMMMGAKVTMADWWLWNQVPVALGNIAGAAVFTGFSLYLTHGRGRASGERVKGLIEELEREHSAIYGALNMVRDLGADSRAAREKLSSIKAELLSHLMKEDKELYPALREAAKRNENLKTALEKLTGGLEEGSRYAIQFLDKYPNGLNESEAAGEFTRLFSIIRERMVREEGVLNEYRNMRAA